MLLLDEYKKNLKNFNDPKMKQKAIWGKISQTLKEKGFDNDWAKCERRLINMKSKYKSTNIHNKQTGNNPKTCSYYQELDDIFGNSPAISPLAICSNLKGTIIEERTENSTSGYGVTCTESTNDEKNQRKTMNHLREKRMKMRNKSKLKTKYSKH